MVSAEAVRGALTKVSQHRPEKHPERWEVHSAADMHPRRPRRASDDSHRFTPPLNIRSASTSTNTTLWTGAELGAPRPLLLAESSSPAAGHPHVIQCHLPTTYDA